MILPAQTETLSTFQKHSSTQRPPQHPQAPNPVPKSTASSEILKKSGVRWLKLAGWTGKVRNNDYATFDAAWVCQEVSGTKLVYSRHSLLCTPDTQASAQDAHLDQAWTLPLMHAWYSSLVPCRSCKQTRRLGIHFTRLAVNCGGCLSTVICRSDPVLQLQIPQSPFSALAAYSRCCLGIRLCVLQNAD